VSYVLPKSFKDKYFLTRGVKMEGEEIIARGKLENTSVVIEGEISVKLYNQGYYGELICNEKLVLNSVEALILLERNKIKVIDNNGKEYTFNELMRYLEKKDRNIWIKYIVYRDLRSRGYIVRSGPGDVAEYRLYERGAKLGQDVAKYLIGIVEEGRPFSLTELDKITKAARSLGKELILAIVDRQGDITYYKVSRLEL